MSVTRTPSIRCDNCGERRNLDGLHVSTGTTARSIRRHLGRLGWRTYPGGRDLCPRCIAEIEAAS